VAAACSDEFMRKYRTQDGFVNIGIVLCGGNVDIAKITKLMQEKGI
jgi:threonine dehydratase